MSTCRTCGAPVVWALHHETGKAAPLEPREDGAFVTLLGEGKVGPRYGLERDFPGEGSFLRYGSHFATCPQADEHRQEP